jgi:putative FmdB family regulatory protein
MPTYEYRCSACAYSFEEFQSITADPFQICPQCGKTTLRRVLGGAGMIFKGSGFYLTDYKKGGDSSSAKSPKGSAEGASPTPEKPSTKSGEKT